MKTATRILVIDDVTYSRQTIKTILSPLHCTIEEADSGDRALPLISERSYELIILDIKMPGIDGMQILEKARKLRPDIAPIIIVTGSLGTVFKAKAKKLGAYAVLDKAPLSAKKLLRTARKALSL